MNHKLLINDLSAFAVDEMIPIVVCTIGSPSLAVLEASLLAYAPTTWLYLNEVERTTFGQSYNAAMRAAFQDHEEIIICNDDVVLAPDSLKLLLEDVIHLKSHYGDKLGIVAAMADNARDCQNVRRTQETHCREARAVSPIFAWVSRAAFNEVQFPPLNWYSDDVLCEDLFRLGYRHFISRSYVHHAGSQTIGTDHEKLNAEAIPWLIANRPDYVRQWFQGRESK